MKKYTSNNGLDWFLLPEVLLTEEQIEIMVSGTDEQKESVLQQVEQERAPQKLEGEEFDFCVSIYNKYKPELKEGDDYVFMSFNFALNGEKAVGSYNYKLNGNINNVILK
jgi:hypothetical protein